MASKMPAVKKPGLSLDSKHSSGKSPKATSSSFGSKSDEYGCGGKNTKTTNNLFGKSEIEFGGKSSFACKNIKTSDFGRNVNTSAKLSTAVGVSGKSCFNTSNSIESSGKSNYVLDAGTKSNFGVGTTSTPGFTGKLDNIHNGVKSNSALELKVKTYNTSGQNGIKYGVTPNLNEKNNSTSGDGNLNSNIFSYGKTTYSFKKSDKIVNTPVVNRKSDLGIFNGKSSPAESSGKFSSRDRGVSVGTSASNDKTRTSSCVGEPTSSIGNLALCRKYNNSNVLIKSNTAHSNNEKGCDRFSNEEKKVYKVDTSDMYSTSKLNKKENTIISVNSESKNIINKDIQSVLCKQNQNKNLVNDTDTKFNTNHDKNPSQVMISKSKNKINEKSLLVTSGVGDIISNKTSKSYNGSEISVTPSSNLYRSTSISNLKTLPSSANLKKSQNISTAILTEILKNRNKCCSVSNTDTKKLKDDKTYIDKNSADKTSRSCKKSENLILNSSTKSDSKPNLKANVNIETKLNENSKVPSGEKVCAKFGTNSRSSVEVHDNKINMPLLKQPKKLNEYKESETVLVSSDVTSKNYSPAYSSLVAPKKKSSIGLGIIWIPGRRRNKKKDMVYQPHQAEYRRERSPSMYPYMSGDSPDNKALKIKEDDTEVIVPEKTKALLATAARDEVVLVNTAAPDDSADKNQDETKEFISRDQRDWEQSIQEGAGDNKDNADRNNTKEDSDEYLEVNEKINKSSNNIFKDSNHEDKVDSVYLRRPPPHKVRSTASTPAATEDEDGCGIKCLYYTVQCCDCVLM